MTEEEPDTPGALDVDEDRDEQLEEMSIQEREDRLKKSRWNVFLYLGVAAILFGFALFPMPFSASHDGLSGSAEKDLGFVWGLPVDGEDAFDVPMRLTVTATSPPTQSSINIAVYVIEQTNCQDYTMSEKMQEAKAGGSHAYQYQEATSRVLQGGTYDFEFNIDPGHYCLVAEYINGDGESISTGDSSLSVEGKLSPNQFIGGFLGLLCLGLSGFAFMGAQKHGQALRSILEGDNETTESKVLSEASKARIAAGPSGAPPSASPGPSGPPGRPPTSPPSEPKQPPTTEPAEPVYELTDDGYYYRKLPDGTYEQTAYYKNADGVMTPHEG